MLRLTNHHTRAKFLNVPVHLGIRYEAICYELDLARLSMEQHAVALPDFLSRTTRLFICWAIVSTLAFTMAVARRDAPRIRDCVDIIPTCLVT